jgi:hypothetical protein
VDGSDQRRVPGWYGFARVIAWSSHGDYMLIDNGYEWPDGYMVWVRDLTVERLLDVAGLQDCVLPEAVPVIAPAGRSIGFAGGQAGSAEQACSTWLYDVDSREVKPLSRHAGAMRWRDAGRLDVLVVRFTAADTEELSLVTVDTSGQLPHTSPVADGLPYAGNRWRLAFAVSPDGRMLAYTGCPPGDGALCVVALDTGQ